MSINLNLKTDLHTVKQYFDANSGLAASFRMLVGAWECQDKSQTDPAVDFLLFKEVSEFLEETITIEIREVLQNQHVINRLVEIKGQPVPIESFIQTQRMVLEYLNELFHESMGLTDINDTISTPKNQSKQSSSRLAA